MRAWLWFFLMGVMLVLGALGVFDETIVCGDTVVFGEMGELGDWCDFDCLRVYCIWALIAIPRLLRV